MKSWVITKSLATFTSVKHYSGSQRRCTDILSRHRLLLDTSLGLFHMVMLELLGQISLICSGATVSRREEFLNFSPETPSIMETFHVSQKRLSQLDGQAWRLIQLYCMLEISIHGAFDATCFFFRHFCRITPEDFPDHDILGAESVEITWIRVVIYAHHGIDWIA